MLSFWVLNGAGYFCDLDMFICLLYSSGLTPAPLLRHYWLQWTMCGNKDELGSCTLPTVVFLVLIGCFNLCYCFSKPIDTSKENYFLHLVVHKRFGQEFL